MLFFNDKSFFCTLCMQDLGKTLKQHLKVKTFIGTRPAKN